jgi:hypothetical protein
MSIRGPGLMMCVAALAGCGSNGSSSSGAGAASGAGAGTGAPSGGSGNETSFVFSSGGQSSDAASSVGSTAVCGSADLSGCIGQRYAGEQIPLDIYIMFDVSCSMSCPSEQTGAGLCCMGGPNPRIDQVRNATTAFLRDPKSDGMGVGIGYFGYMAAGQTSCDPSRYSSPSVPIGALPGNADALVSSLNAARPTGETPTGAAIRGACTYASQWQAKTPGHKTVVLLVTDGFPEAPVTSQAGGCTPTIQDAVQAATTCSSFSPPLPVYVVGVGAQLTNLGDIATAGGTKQPYIVGGADITQQVLDALNQIRALAQIPCRITVPPAPPGTTLKLDEVNVGHCDTSGQASVFNYVKEAASCDATSGGWYYDDPSAPRQIVLCGPTCTEVNIPGGSLFASVGCKTQTNIR